MATTNREQTCCVTGHRKLPKSKIESIVKRLDHEIENLIDQGVRDFISGGALGFDQIAASMIVAKKEMGRDVRLIFALPCRKQGECWSDGQTMLYRSLLTEADEVIYVSEDYFDGCMEKRNRYIVERSRYCICGLMYSRSGTGQTVRFANEQGLRVINVAKQIVIYIQPANKYSCIYASTVIA